VSETCFVVPRRMFRNKVPKRKFGTKNEEVTSELRKLRNEELHNLYSSLDVTRVMTSKWTSVTWAGHVAWVWREETIGIPKSKWADLLKWISKKLDVRVWTGFNFLSVRIFAGLLWTRLWTFKSHEKRRIYWSGENQHFHCTSQLVGCLQSTS
jgi:hypothetical protein